MTVGPQAPTRSRGAGFQCSSRSTSPITFPAKCRFPWTALSPATTSTPPASLQRAHSGVLRCIALAPMSTAATSEPARPVQSREAASARFEELQREIEEIRAEREKASAAIAAAVARGEAVTRGAAVLHAREMRLKVERGERTIAAAVAEAEAALERWDQACLHADARSGDTLHERRASLSPRSRPRRSSPAEAQPEIAARRRGGKGRPSQRFASASESSSAAANAPRWTTRRAAGGTPSDARGGEERRARVARAPAVVREPVSPTPRPPRASAPSVRLPASRGGESGGGLTDPPFGAVSRRHGDAPWTSRRSARLGTPSSKGEGPNSNRSVWRRRRRREATPSKITLRRLRPRLLFRRRRSFRFPSVLSPPVRSWR